MEHDHVILSEDISQNVIIGLYHGTQKARGHRDPTGKIVFLSYACELCNHSDDMVLTSIGNFRFCDTCLRVLKNSETIKKCRFCDNWYFYHEITEIDGKNACKNCVPLLRVCDYCQHVSYRDNGYKIGDYWYCKHTCYTSAGYIRCSHCDEFFMAEDMDHNNYCDTCWNEYVTICLACGNEFFRYDGYDSRYCSEDCHETVNLIHSYSYKPPPMFHKTADDKEENKRFFGLEIEIDNGNASDFCQTIQKDSFLYFKTDASLSCDGLEMVTHPGTLQYHQNYDYESLCEVAKHAGFLSHNTSTCGLHIHVSKNALSLKRWSKIVLFWYSHDALIQAICRRKNNHYCEKKEVYNNDPVRSLTYSDSRYEAINFENLHTVEFRQFKGSLNSITIRASIEFLDFLANWLYRIPARKIMNLTTEETLEAIKNQDKKYVNLNQYISKHFQSTE